MQDLESITKTADVFEKFVWLASQYAPFFFAVFFILFVPIIGQKYFRGFIETKTKSEEERRIAIKLYSFYWLSGVIFGLFLVLVSIIWYMFIQMMYVLPSNKSTWLRERIYTVNIVGVNPDDVIIAQDQNNSGELEAYIHYGYGLNPFMIKIVLFSRERPIKQLGAVRLLYLTRAGWEAMLKFEQGALPLEILVCPSVSIAEINPNKVVDKNISTNRCS